MSNIIQENHTNKFQDLLLSLKTYVSNREIGEKINRHYNTIATHRTSSNPDPILLEAITKTAIGIYQDKHDVITSKIKGLDL